MREDTPIFVITGSPGAGKTHVAEALMRRFVLGVHLSVDILRKAVVSGYDDAVPAWEEKRNLQFRLARETAARAASLYADHGFAVAIDDVILPNELDMVLVEPMHGHRIFKIVLRPTLEVALTRNALRTNKSFDPSVLNDAIRRVHAALNDPSFPAHDWIVIDNSNKAVEETAEEILVRTGLYTAGPSHLFAHQRDPAVP
jgi:chloramphenicol 3-O-phosphotransferase